jgi:hypothetical protein
MPISLISTAGLADTATGGNTSTVGEPSVGASDRHVFVTGNWYASRSTDSGVTWTHVDPFTALPSAAGGFCCDQVVLYVPSRRIWIWILQYIQQGGANVFRIAVTRDANFPTGGWYWWDIAPTTLNAAWTAQWFDYPDAAITNDNLFVTFNMFNAAGAWQRSSVMRFPLDTLANAGTLIFNHWSTTDNGSLRLTQGAGSTMYWGSHNSSNQLRLFSWVDGQNAINFWNVGVGQWNAPSGSNAPNGVNWLARADSRITGAAFGNGRIVFMWTAGTMANRPHSYCRVVVISETSKQALSEPDIFSTSRAWAYPACSTNSAGTIGFTAFYGGVDRHPGHVVGARSDPLNSWVTVYARQGSHSPNTPKWGDYLTCRAHSPRTDTWIAAGYTMQGGETRNDVEPDVVHFRLL